MASPALRPQDILVALKLHTLGGDKPWTLAQVGAALTLSASGVHGSIQRLEQASLLNSERQVRGRNLAEFLVHGLKYWLPPVLGPQSQGILTAMSAPPLAEQLSGGAAWVWPHIEGDAFGQSLQPFHNAVPEAARRDPALHELLALTETFRVGRLREKRLAEEALKQRPGAA